MESPGNLHSMYFSALVCPPVLNEKILRFKLWMREHYGCVVALKSPAHITLVPPFWWVTDLEDELREIIKTFKTDAGEFEVYLKGFSHFGKRVLFVAVEENTLLGNLRDKVVTHFSLSSGQTIPADDRPFHPHVTIANRDLRSARARFPGRMGSFFKKAIQ
jgi:2'-5' RNA ligase